MEESKLDLLFDAAMVAIILASMKYLGVFAMILGLIVLASTGGIQATVQ